MISSESNSEPDKTAMPSVVGDHGIAATGLTKSDKPSGYSYYVLIVVSLIYMFSNIDRKLPLILVQSIKHDLSLSDTQIGLATGIIFSLVYATFGIPIARVADKYGRIRVICWSLLAWSAITGLNGLAANFWQFALARGGVAIGEGGATPAAQSLLPDFFPLRRLGLAGGFLLAAAPVGYMLALAGGGFLNDLASWRVAMMAMAVPGIALAILARLTIKEPVRSRTSATAPLPPLRASIAKLWRIKTYRHLFLAAMTSGAYQGAFGAFLPAYIMRNFGYTAAHTGWSFGLLAATAGISASLAGGFFADKFADRDARVGLWFIAIVAFISGPVSVGALFTSNYVLFLALMFVPQASITAWSGPTTVAIMALADRRMRAFASALYLFSSVGIGFSIGPVLAGALSDSLHPVLGHNSLKWALITLAVIPFWTTAHYLIAASKLKGDVAAAKS